jgi:hypothetical protein
MQLNLLAAPHQLRQLNDTRSKGATTSNMSFQDIEAGRAPPLRTSSSSIPQSREDNAFQNLQSSLSLQVFKMNANVQGILKLVDQLGTGMDSATLRKSLCVAIVLCTLYAVAEPDALILYFRHDLTDTTRAMAKRGCEDLKKLSALQMSLVSLLD